ncbi:hypothetical protein FHS18_004034 [Paenibacillus phyllosphaerae]|uniref:Uncharacterized protein n=1 Tax=Paenibacillus phyllosphaerae TaxID=274593 RepID=A0A7W5B1I0_9BACL|nr:hypothetical protein [Paenibacillus phyllosphaerae]MBB3111966.1 hypothetical protein [Paenibacillus phyllosphaerae]
MDFVKLMIELEERKADFFRQLQNKNGFSFTDYMDGIRNTFLNGLTIDEIIIRSRKSRIAKRYLAMYILTNIEDFCSDRYVSQILNLYGAVVNALFTERYKSDQVKAFCDSIIQKFQTPVTGTTSKVSETEVKCIIRDWETFIYFTSISSGLLPTNDSELVIAWGIDEVSDIDEATHWMPVTQGDLSVIESIVTVNKAYRLLYCPYEDEDVIVDDRGKVSMAYLAHRGKYIVLSN